MATVAPAKILSLNVGEPADMPWNGRSIRSSMLKKPVKSLIVNLKNIEGDSFASPEYHGTPDSVLYGFGMKSILKFLALLGRSEYSPGELGENLTLDEF